MIDKGEKYAISTNKEIAEIVKSLEKTKKGDKPNQEIIKLKKEKEDLLANYRIQMVKIEEDNQSNNERYSKEQHDLTKNIERFWNIIGIIDGLLNDKDARKLIENVRIAHKSIEKFQNELINETITGSINFEKNGNDRLVSSWREDKKPQITQKVDEFEKVVDILIDYIRDNGMNRPLLRCRRLCYLWQLFGR